MKKHFIFNRNFIKTLLSKIPNKEWHYLYRAFLYLMCILFFLTSVGSISKMAIYVNSQKIGYVENEEEAVSLVEDYNNFVSEYNSVSNIMLKNELSFSQEALSNGDVEDKINTTKNQEFLDAFGLYFDGTLVAVSDSTIALYNAISQIETSASNALYRNVTIYNNIEIQNKFYPTESIVGASDLCSYILGKEGLTKNDFTHATALNEKKDTIMLYSVNGILFEAFAYRTAEYTTKAETIYIEDETVRQGTEILKEEGQDGKIVKTYKQTIFESKVLFEELINTQVTAEVKNKVVVVGTKKEDASSDNKILLFPLNTDNFTYTSEFGGRVDPISGEYDFHSGIDIACSVGTSVLAASDGEVIASTDNGGNAGITITIRHSNGLITQYMHLSKRFVEVGAKVYAGQEIALSGNSGRSTGPHLHFSLYNEDGELLNPRRYTKIK